MIQNNFLKSYQNYSKSKERNKVLEIITWPLQPPDLTTIEYSFNGMN